VADPGGIAHLLHCLLSTHLYTTFIGPSKKEIGERYYDEKNKVDGRN
jgi:hypothetical protein